MTTLVRFREAMAAQLGKQLTPEMAAQIEAEAFCEPDNSIEPARFTPQQYGHYTIQAESFRLIRDELTPLHEAHYAETESYRKAFPLNPNYQALFARERAGQLLQFTARFDGKIVAHLRMFINNSLHTQTNYADEDTLFATQEHRGGFLVIRLMRYAEAALLSLGVREIRANSKLVNRADILMRRLGYEPVALQFCKIFKE